MGFKKLGKSLEDIIWKIRKLSKIDKEEINSLIIELQRSLLLADVNVDIVFQMTENIKNKVINSKMSQQVKIKNLILKAIHNELVRIIGGKKSPIRMNPNKTNIIIVVGIQGSGKTTTVGKLASFYKNKGYKVATLTTDNWRLGAYEQLVHLSKQVGVKCYGNPNEKNALRIAVRETKKAINDANDVIIVDTAGRHKEEKQLMNEMAKMSEILKPNEIILVVDGTLGQQAFNQAEEFAKVTDVGSIIATKVDGTSKGGGALSACVATGVGIKFLADSEKISDLEEFEPDSFIKTLLGIPNLDALINKVKTVQSKDDLELQKRLIRGKFTLDDLCNLIKNIKKVGKFKNLLSMLGGENIPDTLKDDAENNILKWEVILSSLTQEEKESPNIINKERKRRIQHGAGVDYAEINRMLDQYRQMKNMMNRLDNRRNRFGDGANFPGNFPRF